MVDAEYVRVLRLSDIEEVSLVLAVLPTAEEEADVGHKNLAEAIVLILPLWVVVRQHDQVLRVRWREAQGDGRAPSTRAISYDMSQLWLVTYGLWLMTDS